MQYTIAKAHTPELLMEAVNSKIQEGWVPQGGIAVANASNMIYAQAMIKG